MLHRLQTFAECSLVCVVLLPVLVVCGHKCGQGILSVAVKFFLCIILSGQLVFSVWMMIEEFGAAGDACDQSEHAAGRHFEDAVFICAAVMISVRT